MPLAPPVTIMRLGDSGFMVSFASQRCVAKYQQRVIGCQRSRLKCPDTGPLYGIRISRGRMASHAGSEESRENEPEYVMGLEKGLSIIEAFGMKKGPLTVTQAAEITGHTKGSVRRRFLTLCRLGYA